MNTQKYKTVHLDYFALIKEHAGKAGEDIDTTAVTASELYNEIQKRYNLALRKETLRVSINDTFSSWPTKLKSGDRVAFIPPVSGG